MIERTGRTVLTSVWIWIALGVLVCVCLACLSSASVRSFRDALGCVLAVALGFAIPAQMAFAARAALRDLMLVRFQVSVDAVGAGCTLAEQAEAAVCTTGYQTEFEAGPAASYFQSIYNQTQIDHTMKRIDAIDIASLPSQLARSAVDSARRNMRDFFMALRDASREFDDFRSVPDRDIRILRTAYEAFVKDADILDRECRRLGRSSRPVFNWGSLH
jgi:hypothetical protein